MQQRIKLDNNVILTDTPGFLWPKLSPPTCGYRLAVTGAIKDTVFDYADIAMFAADYLLKTYPQAVMQRFGLTELPENDLALMDAIGVKRGAMRKGGVVDLEKAGSILITELRAGNLGPITLETPEMVSQEQIDAKAEEGAKAKEKADREAERKRKAARKYR